MEDEQKLKPLPSTIKRRMKKRILRCFYLVSLTLVCVFGAGCFSFGWIGYTALAVLLSFHLASLVFGCLMQFILKKGYSYWYWVDMYLQHIIKKTLYLAGISLIMMIVLVLVATSGGDGFGGLLLMELLNIVSLIVINLQIGWVFAKSQILVIGTDTYTRPFYPFLCWILGTITLFILFFTPQYHFIHSLMEQGYFGRTW
ncbi:MAG: hypothetical protein H2174_07055 [Vampirovibrio sp.]|nr:hypothetical protein [Vampirovibrio sp.]